MCLGIARETLYLAVSMGGGACIIVESVFNACSVAANWVLPRARLTIAIDVITLIVTNKLSGALL